MSKKYLYQLLFTALCLLLVYLFTPTRAGAQTDSLSKKTIRGIHAEDTTVLEQNKELYELLLQKTSKNKVTKTLYSALFKSPVSDAQLAHEGATEDKYKPYEGRTINDIKIVVLKPFGTDINHPDSSVSNSFNRISNSVHVDTRHYIIHNNLLFETGDRVHALTMAENETFLRNTGYISDVSIIIDSIPGTREANVTVVVADVWPIGFELSSVASNALDMKVFDKNFLGVGSNVFIRSIYNGGYGRKFGYGFGYTYNNFLRSFINLSGQYFDGIVSTSTSLSADRPLQTVLQYFGQLSYECFNQRLQFATWDSISPPYKETVSISFGRSFNFSSPQSAQRFVLAGRYLYNNASYNMVTVRPDPLEYRYASKRTFLAQFSLYEQRYYRQYLIHNFGITESVPYGYNISAQVGYNRYYGYFQGLYASLSLSAGKQFSFGNVYASAAISSNFNEQGKVVHGVKKFHFRYYSPFGNVGNRRFRSFVNINYAASVNPVEGMVEYIFLNTTNNLQIANLNYDTKGVERLVLDIENDVFSNMNLIGFRFVFFNFIDIGWLKQQGALISGRNFYWGTGFGVRIRNELLVFRTIELKLGYYPQFHQKGFNDYFNFDSFNPRLSPSFIPSYPQEISLQ